jgi:hypothetical protein
VIDIDGTIVVGYNLPQITELLQAKGTTTQ